MSLRPLCALFGAIALAAGPLAAQTVQTAQPAPPVIPPQLADTTFWRMVTEMSEPGGYFRSDNFVSNESSYQWIIPELQRTIKPGGVYVGVAPDQNFTYLVALKPRIAFIVDIRHQNAMQHLMYKALMEVSADRADFVARLFSRARPAGLDTTSTAVAIFEAFAGVPTDSATYRRNLAAIKDRLLRVHGFALNEDELRGLEYVYSAFYSAGPNLTYNFGAGGGGYGGGYGRGMPTYQALMMETDGSGANRAYLGTEANYRALKTMEEHNLIVPLTGNFAGEKALRGVGQWVRERGGTITTFYTSNVEQYLFMQDDEASRFYRNVATLPLDSTSTFIRSYSMGAGYPGFRQQSPNSRSVQLFSSMADVLKAFAAGPIGYYTVIQMSRQ